MGFETGFGGKPRGMFGSILTTTFAGAILMGLHSTAQWACTLHQQMHLAVPEWIPRLIVGNAIVVCRWLR